MLTGMASPDWSLQPLDEVELSDKDADAWVKRGLAVYVGGEDDEENSENTHSANRRTDAAGSESGRSKKSSKS